MTEDFAKRMLEELIAIRAQLDRMERITTSCLIEMTSHGVTSTKRSHSTPATKPHKPTPTNTPR
jgi:hypothetical protein